MLLLKYPLSGKDSALISDLYRLHSGLSTLALYHDHPRQLPDLGLVKEKLDFYQVKFEGGKTGNHADIAQRDKARREVVGMFRMIIHYLEVIATEDDIPALIQAGLTIVSRGGRRKAAVAPA